MTKKSKKKQLYKAILDIATAKIKH